MEFKTAVKEIKIDGKKYKITEPPAYLAGELAKYQSTDDGDMSAIVEGTKKLVELVTVMGVPSDVSEKLPAQILTGIVGAFKEVDEGK